MIEQEFASGNYAYTSSLADSRGKVWNERGLG